MKPVEHDLTPGAADFLVRQYRTIGHRHWKLGWYCRMWVNNAKVMNAIAPSTWRALDNRGLMKRRPWDIARTRSGKQSTYWQFRLTLRGWSLARRLDRELRSL